MRKLAVIHGVWFALLALSARGAAMPAALLQPSTHSALVRSTTESLPSVLAQIDEKLSRIETLSCSVEMSKKREKKVTRKVYTGELVIARGRGGRVILTRKGETEEYLANARELWSYDHKKKHAVVLSVNTPIIGFFVAEALKFNAFMAMEPGTIEFLGYQTTNGEACWVFQGRSPSRLRLVGVPVRKMRVWISQRDGLPREIKIPEEKDLTIILRDVQINVGVGDNEFQWQSPDGVKIKRIMISR
ncbi:MAG: LolA family protein [Candidatus Sumerlaeaceae bacterium]|jgi:outer membrane lipoprotein-sorting protein